MYLTLHKSTLFIPMFQIFVFFRDRNRRTKREKLICSGGNTKIRVKSVLIEKRSGSTRMFVKIGQIRNFIQFCVNLINRILSW